MMKPLILLATLLSFGLTVQAADPEAGKKLTLVCTGCHAADGNSVTPNFPKLAGLGERYLLKQLLAIQSGDRPIPEMTGLLNGLSEADLANMAAYYDSQTVTLGAADPDLVEKGKKIYRSGNLAKGLSACIACHGPTGKGLEQAGFPALSGQHAAYVSKQLKDYRVGNRSTDGEARIMRAIAERMSDAEIEAVASYISGLH